MHVATYVAVAVSIQSQMRETSITVGNRGMPQSHKSVVPNHVEYNLDPHVGHNLRRDRIMREL